MFKCSEAFIWCACLLNIHIIKASMILILQNLFHQGKYNRDISLNSHYFILFKNPKDVGQIKVLGRPLGKYDIIVSPDKVGDT